MTEVRYLLYGLGWFLLAQSLSWFQTNGQFFSQWAKNNPIVVALVMGIPIGLSYIYGTSNIVTYFDGTLWPSRLIGFATGIFSFTVLTYIIAGETINLKTATILTLAIIILILQVFWNYE